MTTPGALRPSASVSAPGSTSMPTLTSTARKIATATWYTHRAGNDVWFRAEAPAEAVGGRVAYLSDKKVKRACSYPNRDTGLPWSVRFLTADGFRTVSSKKEWVALTKAGIRYEDVEVLFPKHEGTAVWTRPDGQRAVLANQMREQGVLTVAETDDNYLSAAQWNFFLRFGRHDEKAVNMITRSFASFDRNVFSTVWLRDRYHREFKKRLGKRNLPELFVCRNHIPRSAWPERDEGDGRLRVGFMGSPSHMWDINMAYAAFHDARAVAGAEVVMVGYNPADHGDEPDEIQVNGETVQLRTQKANLYQSKWAEVIDRAISWIEPGEYRRAALPLDIGVAPISTANDFTLGKSDAKALEYTISGAACVLSGAGIYGAAGWKHEVNCLIATSREEFARQTVRLCLDEKLRYELVSAAQEYVWNERNEDVMRTEWEDALCL